MVFIFTPIENLPERPSSVKVFIMLVEFFNLARTGLSPLQAIAWLAEKYSRPENTEQRIFIWTRDREQAGEVDAWLWSYSPVSFLPHALADFPEAEDEPILISPELNNINRADTLLLAFNPPASWTPDPGFRRVIELIPSQPGPELEAGRHRYRMLSKKYKLLHTTEI
ncbi:MAG: DNA polymerase III subunit chi [Desulfarculales bacterium]|jgi:DNA polymerase IIIc chi subunit|nr:DNA polymerase III subunit chi [Desulfarculales bacterium]